MKRLIQALSSFWLIHAFTSSIGKMMIAGSLVMMGIGSMIIKKIVSFKE